MSDRPNIFLDSPDALSSLLTGLRLKAELYVDGDFCGAWAVDNSGKRLIPFHLISQGDAWLHMPENAPERLHPGDLVLFPRDTQHYVSHSPEAPDSSIINVLPPVDPDKPVTHMICGNFEFENRAAWPLLDSLPDVMHIDLADRSHSASIRNYIDLIICELKRELPGYYACANQLSYLLFVEILRVQIDKGTLKTGLLTALFDERIGHALALIHNKPEIGWSLETLAAEVAMSRSSFAALFTHLTGESAMRYLTRWRMEQARSLLLETEQSIDQIAVQVGYESTPAFRKTFKKTLNKTPGEVRRAKS